MQEVGSKELQFLINLEYHGIQFNSLTTPLKPPGKTAGEMFPETIAKVLCELSKSFEYSVEQKQKLAKALMTTGMDAAFLTKPLKQAAIDGQTELMALYLDSKMITENLMQECLFLACQHGKDQCAKLLFDQGSDPLCEDEAGRTLLDVAFERKCVDFLQYAAQKNGGVKQKLLSNVTLQQSLQITDVCRQRDSTF